MKGLLVFRILTFVATATLSTFSYGANIFYVYNYGPPTVSTNDFARQLEFANFAQRLQKQRWASDKKDFFSELLYLKLDQDARNSLANFSARYESLKDPLSDEASQKTQKIIEISGLEQALAKNLNRIIEGPCIYDKKGFRDFDLCFRAKELLKQKPTGSDLKRLNWLLLNDACFDFARGAIQADGVIRGFIRKKQEILHIQIFPTRLTDSELKDIWIGFSATNKIALVALSKKHLDFDQLRQFSLCYKGNQLVSISIDAYGFSSQGKKGKTLLIGSFKRNKSLSLPCSIKEYEAVFGKADEIQKKLIL